MGTGIEIAAFQQAEKTAGEMLNNNIIQIAILVSPMQGLVLCFRRCKKTGLEPLAFSAGRDESLFSPALRLSHPAAW